MRRRFLMIMLLATLGIVSACSFGGASIALPSGVVYPKIVPDDSTGIIGVDYAFDFEGKTDTFHVDVQRSLYQGAASAQKSVVRFGSSHANDWIERYYPAFIEESHQDAFFSALLAQLRALRDQQHLDSDRYAELLVVFVQSIEYKTDPVNLSPKFPVETFVDKNGDCDDKTLLLAGLLSREGYDVAVLLFDAEKHVAIGIKSDGIEYKNTGYAYVETTAPGFIGMVPDELGQGITLASDPQVFKIGDGTLHYTSGAQVARILQRRTELKAQADGLSAQVKSADSALATLRAQADSLHAQLSERQSAGDIASYNALVPEYNATVQNVNASTTARNALADRYNTAVKLERYIYEHLSDRTGVYQQVAG